MTLSTTNNRGYYCKYDKGRSLLRAARIAFYSVGLVNVDLQTADQHAVSGTSKSIRRTSSRSRPRMTGGSVPL